MLAALTGTIVALSMLAGWGLLIVASCDYLLGNLLGLFATSKQNQVWGLFSGAMLAIYPTFYWRRNPLKRCWLKLKMHSAAALAIGQACKRLGGLLRRGYTYLYQLADVLFCIGLPMLVVTALVGWWLIDEINLISMVLYLCLLLAISITGIYSNAVRMLSLGYFNGYWFLDSDWLSFPFAAPMRVQQNIDRMVAEVGLALLPVLGVICLLLYLARSVAFNADGLGLIRSNFFKRRLNIVKKKSDHSVWVRTLSLIALLVGISITFICVNSLIELLNIHLFFAASAIVFLDFCWKTRLSNEPALSGDVQYLLSGLWRS